MAKANFTESDVAQIENLLRHAIREHPEACLAAIMPSVRAYLDACDADCRVKDGWPVRAVQNDPVGFLADLMRDRDLWAKHGVEVTKT